MPVHAIVERRHWLGVVEKPMASTAAASDSTRSGSTSRTTIFWYGVVRTRVDPCDSAMSARAVSVDPETRPTRGEKPTYDRPSACSCTPTWSPFRAGLAGGSPSMRVRPRYLSSST